MTVDNDSYALFSYISNNLATVIKILSEYPINSINGHVHDALKLMLLLASKDLVSISRVRQDALIVNI